MTDDLKPRLSVGGTGSGKTHRIAVDVARRLEAGGTTVVVDVNGEWPKPPVRQHRPVKADGPRSLEKALADGHPWVIVRPPLAAIDDEAKRPQAKLIDALAEACMGHDAILVVPELAESARGQYLPPKLGRLVRRSRHPAVRAGVWGDSQHFRDVSTELRNELAALYVCAGLSHRDCNELAEVGGGALADAAREVTRRAQPRPGGGYAEPGWHLAIDPRAAQPPYSPVRI